jgi:hypothetical protein
MLELEMSRYAQTLVEQTGEIAALVEGAELSQWVSTCPEWDLRRLIAHVGQAHRFGADLVRRRVTEPGLGQHRHGNVRQAPERTPAHLGEQAYRTFPCRCCPRPATARAANTPTEETTT